jgi:hypothetical protein
MGDVIHPAIEVFVAAIADGASRPIAFEKALAVWRARHPEHSELRAGAELASAIWASGRVMSALAEETDARQSLA